MRIFLTRNSSILFRKMTKNTANYCVKGPAVPLSLCLRPSDTSITISKTTVKSSRFMWVDTCMHIYVHICVHLLQVYYTYAYTYMNLISKWNQLVNETITVQNTLTYRKTLNLRNQQAYLIYIFIYITN